VKCQMGMHSVVPYLSRPARTVLVGRLALGQAV
jgi:hypothetical protein